MALATATPHKFSRPWSSGECNILRTAIAAKFGIDRVQVILDRHATRRGLPFRDRQEILEQMEHLDGAMEMEDATIPGGYISLSDLSAGMGIPVARLISWIQDKDFQKCLKPRMFGASWGIPYRGLRRFLRRYPGEVDLAVRRDQIDLVWLISLLLLHRGGEE